MVGENMFNGLGAFGAFLAIGLVAIIIVICSGLYGIIDYFFIDDKYESKKLIVPDVIITTEDINGKTKSDTTYVYTFN
jgi:hypothetical protein